MRLLTQSEYKNALTDLLGAIEAPLELPEDTHVDGFVSIGASLVTVNATAASLYEAASRAAAAEVFADADRWPKFVGCEPRADLSDACVVWFIQKVGRRAYRRDLSELEVQRWLQVGKDIAQLPESSAARGLETITSGLLQSFNFLYRVENNQRYAGGRLVYDGSSMATRLAFLLTGRPPSDALLDAAAAGQLATAAGVREAAAPLLNDPSAIGRMAQFFSELSEARLVSLVPKSPELFPSFNAELQRSMAQATQLFIENIVLAPGADVRSFYDSNQTFVDARLAAFHGVSAPASGFMQVTLPSQEGRAGILGQPAVLAGHSAVGHSSPSHRGLFVVSKLLCDVPLPPPDGVITNLPTPDPNLTTRQNFEALVAAPACAGCHATFNQFGFALEHFDAIGRFRATENGKTIDATGTLDGVAFDGAAQLGSVLGKNPRALACLMTSFYRDANGRQYAKADAAQIEALGQTLAAHNYVWRELVEEFVVSDAFRSAPAARSPEEKL